MDVYPFKSVESKFGSAGYLNGEDMAVTDDRCALNEAKRTSINSKVYNIYHLVELLKVNINVKFKMHRGVYTEVTEL